MNMTSMQQAESDSDTQMKVQQAKLPETQPDIPREINSTDI